MRDAAVVAGSERGNHEGAGIEELKKTLLNKFYAGKKVNLQLNVEEIKQPNLSAAIVGESIALDMEKRMPFRRTMKRAIERVMQAGFSSYITKPIQVEHFLEQIHLVLSCVPQSANETTI